VGELVGLGGPAEPGGPPGGWVVAVSSDGRGEGRGPGPTLGPDQAVVLRPRS
jgi:hypothetical protein